VADAYLGDALSPAPPAQPGAGRGGRGATPPPFQPSASDVRSYAGRYTSDEAETVLTVEVLNTANASAGDLVITRRPDTTLRMRPIERDVFAVPTLGTVTFRRNPAGQVNEFSIKLDRVWDLRFQRAQ
jgi:hypothetical protein